MTALFEVLERYWYVLVFAAFGLWVMSLHGDLSDQRVRNAELVAQIAADTAARERVAREHEEQLARREQEHARAQQEKDEQHARQTDDLRRERDLERNRATGLRLKLTQATARASAGSEADPVACGRAFDRLETLGGLAGEGVELLAEGRGLLRQCEVDRSRLWEQIQIDRAAMGQ